MRRVFVLVSLPMTTNANTIRYVSDALRPYCLVQFGVHSNIRRPHLLLGKLFDGFYRSRGTSFEPHAMDVLVKVDGVLASHHFFQGRPPFLVSLSRHVPQTRAARKTRNAHAHL